MLGFGIRNPGADKVVLQPGNPATGHALAQLLVVQVGQTQLGVGVIGTPVGGTEEGGHTGCGRAGRITTAIALDLTKQAAAPGLRALVVDQVADVDQIAATGEGEALGEIHAVAAGFQVNNQLLLAVCQSVAVLLDTVACTAGGLVRALLPCQTTLSNVGTVTRLFQQLERQIRTILAGRILRQGE